jgi:cytochrome c oxidase cbb3-type subunit 4
MTYQEAQVWSQVAALVIFMSLAIGIAIYTFRPANKAKFERAARLPLNADDNDKTVN